MLIKRGEEIPRQLLQVIMDAGGLGDNLARLVAVRESLRLAPYLDLRIFVPETFKPLVLAAVDLAEYLKSGRLLVFTFGEMADNLNRIQSGVQFSKRLHSPGRLSLVQDALLTIADTLCDIGGKSVNEDYVKLGHREYNKDYFGSVALTSESTTDVRAMPQAEIRKMSRWLLAKGHKVILVGSEKNGPDIPHTVDLRGNLTLLETQGVLGNCTHVVGLDNGLIHLAGTCQYPPKLVVGYTSVAPKYRQIFREGKNIVYSVSPEEIQGEKHTQSQMNFLFNHDFRNCLYGDNDFANSMTADLLIKAAKRAGL